MTKIWLIGKSTYRPRIRSGTFLILTFGLPLLMVIAGAIPFLSARAAELPRIGVVDRTGRLDVVDQAAVEGTVMEVSGYAGVEEAQAAWVRDEIDGYLVIPDGYFQGESPVFYGEEPPGPVLEDALAMFMREAMLADQPGWMADRLADPSDVTYVARATGEQVAEGIGILVHVGTPLVLALVFGLVVFSSASQMGAVMVREKDQGAMEMVITSLAPWQLVVGKVLGMTLLALTQIVLWTAAAGLAIGLALVGADEPALSIPWRALIWAALLGMPGYFLYAVLGAGLGIIAGDQQQARQLSGLLGFLGFSPLYFLGALVNNMDSPLAQALTWFPLTAPMLALFRMALGQVPDWQLAVSLAILLLSLVAAVWLVARIFRTTMLMYGQSLRLAQIWRALRQA
jgi:ABC-2 type transport system permease protein